MSVSWGNRPMVEPGSYEIQEQIVRIRLRGRHRLPCDELPFEAHLSRFFSLPVLPLRFSLLS